MLLEPNEIYFEDFAVNVIQLDAQGEPLAEADDDMMPMSWTGRLKMCSKSIVYNPRDALMPIVKIHYRDCEQIFQLPESFHSHYVNVLAVRWVRFLLTGFLYESYIYA